MTKRGLNTRRLDRVLGRAKLAALAEECGGQVIRIPSRRTVRHLNRIDAARALLDSGLSYVATARSIGISTRQVVRLAKKTTT